MNAYDFVHLALLAVGGEIQGKTKLQKIVYFLGVLTDEVDDLGYHPHFYGPYSEEVSLAVARLRGLGFLDQELVGGGAVGKFGFEVVRYDFSLNDQGKAMGGRKARQNPSLWEKLTIAAKKLHEALQEDYMSLSIAAKTYFMLGRKQGRASVGELARLSARFGWSVQERDVRRAAQLLERIGLVKLKEDT